MADETGGDWRQWLERLQQLPPAELAAVVAALAGDWQAVAADFAAVIADMQLIVEGRSNSEGRSRD